MSDGEDVSQGQKLLSAVERMLADTPSLVAYANECRDRAAAAGHGATTIRTDAAREIVGRYSTLTAVSGGVAALPAIVPGVGTAVAVTGGTLADVAFMLKYEVEMALVLSHVFGFDIRDDRERQRAFLLASLSTFDAKSGGNFVGDVLKVESVALWNYAPREVSKLLLTVLTHLAVASFAKGLFRALPFVGIAVSSAMNKTLTTRVGERCVNELLHRSRQSRTDVEASDEDIVDAHIRGREQP